jgi:ribonuclease BN (tRNA processing enzyme)
MDITILGSGTGIPSLRRSSPSIMIESEKSTIICDTGPGTLRQIIKTGKTLNDIDIIIYSHFHIDHISDMIPFIFACKYAPGKFRTGNIKIIGCRGIKQLFHNLTIAYGHWVVPDHFSIEWHEEGEGTIFVNDLVIKTLPVNHIESSIAFRIEDRNGNSVVYSGDTDYCLNIIKLAYKADILILECSFPEGMKCDGHLIPSLAGKIARESQCKKLVLTHFYPPCEGEDIMTPLRNEFSGEVVLAEDLMKITP